jgi:hypothetical protein
MAFDATNQRTLLYGGRAYPYGQSGPTNSELWAWQGSDWQLLGSAPSNAAGADVAFCTFAGGVLFHGGYFTAPLIFSFLRGDTWKWQGGTWTQVATTGPSARSAHQMVETPQGVLLFGGTAYVFPSSTQVYNDTWLWNGSTWSQLNPATNPPATSGHSMTYDANLGVVVLLVQPTLLSAGQTWEWNGTDWVLRTTGVPSAGTIVFSPAANRTLLCNGAQTWAWNGAVWQPFPTTGPAPAASVAAGSLGLLSFSGYPPSDNTSVLATGPTATVASFGIGCAGPGNMPSLTNTPGSQPIPGTTFSFRVSNLPSGLSVPVLVLGSSNTMNTSPVYGLPIDLGFAGLPGCQQFVSIDLMEAAAVLTPQHDVALAIPPQVSVLGLTVFGQAMVLYVGGGVGVSNALAATIGV